MISESPQGTPSTVLQVLKQRVSRRLRKDPTLAAQGWGTPSNQRLGGGPGDSLPQFWQRRFHDFNVWSPKEKIEKLNYMHNNPVERSLVVRPMDWPWSSYSFYAEGEPGLVRIDPID